MTNTIALWPCGEVLEGIAPSYEELHSILKDVVEGNAKTFQDLIQLGHNKNHLAYLKMRFILQTTGLRWGFSFLVEDARKSYDYYTREVWEERLKRIESRRK